MILSFFSNLQLSLKIKIDNRTNYSFFTIRLFGGLIRLRFNFSLKSLDKRAVSVILRKTDSGYERHTEIDDIFQLISKAYKKYSKHGQQLKRLVSKATIHHSSLNMTVGVGDAAQTALLSGAMLTILTFMNVHMKNTLRLEESQIKLTPFFGGMKFAMSLDCIIDIKLGHIIITGIRMLTQSIKGGEISGRTSY